MSIEPEHIVPPAIVAEWVGDAQTGCLKLLDQTLLPGRESYITCHNAHEACDAIRRLAVRGAPAIGIAGAYAMVLAAQSLADGDDPQTALASIGQYVSAARPTAVNLPWAVRRVLDAVRNHASGPAVDYPGAILAEARAIHAEDAALCLAIGQYAAPLVARCRGVLTHCNAGALATGGIGTATAGMYVARARGAEFAVYCDETRPLLQGSRLTAWELMQAGIDTVVITDSMAAQVMTEGRVQMVITGADRIAANGDTANKIGTYGLAIAAARHGIDFYVAAPYSTFDLATSSGAEIPIEQRGAEEITCGMGRRTAPEGVRTYCPAFDVTPADLITGIITDRGIIQPVGLAEITSVMGGI